MRIAPRAFHGSLDDELGISGKPKYAIDLAAIQAAAKAIAPYITPTALTRSVEMTELASTEEKPREIYVKAEHKLPTGSYEVRGALNVVASMDDEAAARGIVEASSGKFARALAYASQAMPRKVPCTIVLPPSDHTGYSGLSALGATVEVSEYAASKAHELESAGARRIDELENSAMLAGFGTVGLEIALQTGSTLPAGESAPMPTSSVCKLDAVVVPIGCGGLISGVAMALKALNPGVTVVGVLFDTVNMSLSKGEDGRMRTPLTEEPILDEMVGPNSKKIIIDFVDQIVYASERSMVPKGMSLVTSAGGAADRMTAAAVAAAVEHPDIHHLKRVAVII